MKSAAKFKISLPIKMLQFVNLFTLMFVAIACVPNQFPAFYDVSCSPPCWAGIHPGITTFDESLNIIEAYDTVEEGSLKVVEGLGNHRLSWDFGNGSGGRINYQSNISSVITLWYEQGFLTVGEVFNKLGQPPQYFPVHHTTETFYLTVHFLYPELGFVALIRIDNVLEGNTVVIDETLPVVTTFYFEPEKFELMMTEGAIWLQSPDELQRRVRGWEGYGEIDYGEVKSIDP